MDAITKDSKEWLAALALVPETGMKECDPWPNGLCPHYHAIAHSIPPDITPDLLYTIRRAIEAKGHEWVLKYYQRDEIYEFRIYGSYGAYLEETGVTESDAIIRAAASLQEAK